MEVNLSTSARRAKSSLLGFKVVVAGRVGNSYLMLEAIPSGYKWETNAISEISFSLIVQCIIQECKEEPA